MLRTSSIRRVKSLKAVVPEVGGGQDALGVSGGFMNFNLYLYIVFLPQWGIKRWGKGCCNLIFIYLYYFDNCCVEH